MAELYRARTTDDRLAVIKEVLPELAKHPRYIELLVAEAQLTGMLNHPNIVKVIGFGRRADSGMPYIALEHVDGVDLRGLLRGCTERKVALPIKHALTIVSAVLRALHHAHQARDERGERLEVVHCDVSPSNVLLGFDGTVRLCDFGIARSRVMPEVPGDSIQGKAGYMSPEHAQGEELDARADVFAAGIMLWELLHGRRMRKNKGAMSLLAQAREAEVPVMVVRGLPGEETLHGIVRRALCADREARYQSAGEMLRDLERYAAEAGLSGTEAELALFLAESFPDIRDDRLATRRRMIAAPDVDVDETPCTPPVGRPSVASGPRRIQRRNSSPWISDSDAASAGADKEPRRLTDLLFIGSLACAATLSLLTLLSSLGVL
jgi:serine/threonine-protein kinase